jgi:hypothetical protein
MKISTLLKRILLLCSLCITISTVRAQYVAIPDSNFGNWLFTHGYDSCMTGNATVGYQMDTICSRSFEYNAYTLDLSHLNISDLTGLHYISWGIGYQNYGINLSYNNFNHFPPQLSERMTADFWINLNYNHIDTFILDSTVSQISKISMEHNGMHYFVKDASFGNGNSIEDFDFSYNNLDTFPVFYSGGYLGGGYTVEARSNRLQLVPGGGHVVSVDCGNNLITNGSLNNIDFCSWLSIDSNLLITLDVTNLGYYGGVSLLNCAHNHLTSITGMNLSSMGAFICNDNNLISIPHFPPDLGQLDCHNNPLLQCIPSLPNVSVFTLNFSNTAVQCLPKQFPYCVYTSTPAINSVPTCDLYNNTYGCPQYSNLEGYSYITDTSHTCIMDSAEAHIGYIKAQFLQNGTIQQQAYSDWNGHYSFDQLAYGTYTLQVDTSYLPITVVCPDTFYYTAIVDSPNFYQSGFNFGMNCKAGYDVGVQGISYSLFRPAHLSYVTFSAGDMSQLYGLHCAAGTGGQVQMTYSGPVALLAIDTNSGGIYPTSVSGNILTWIVTDYGTLNDNSFAFIFLVDSTAQNSDQVCFSVTVTPAAGDNNPSNNTAYLCDQVHVAFDPNEKSVYPAGEIDTTVKWLTYTIHFQNTGTGPAQNIKVTDTLDSSLDPNSFQLLNYSYKNVTQLFGNVVVFNFPGINLPDSAVSQTASTGYVQYRIKLKPNLPIGTTIFNTANIYFDFNSPVVTNTTYDRVTTGGCNDTAISISNTICQGDSFSFAGQYYFSSVTLSDTLTGTGGCDSIITLNLTVTPLTYTSSFDTICSGDSLSFGYQYLTAPGIYHDTIQSVSGCNIIETLYLTVRSLSYTAMSQVICSGDSFYFGHQYLSQPGMYADTLAGSAGCDSIATLTLIVRNILITSLSQNICAGSTYTFGSQVLTSAGVYRDTVTSSAGCDSVILLTLGITATSAGSLAHAMCQGDTFVFAGQRLAVAGTYMDTLANAGGCDSIVVLNLTVHPLPVIVWNMTDTTYIFWCYLSHFWVQYPGFNNAIPAGGTYSGVFVVNDSIVIPDGYQQDCGFDTTFSIKYTYTDSNGCSNSMSRNIIYHTYAEGIATISGQSSISLYPNPNTGTFTLTSSGAVGVEYTITDMLGKLITQQKITNNTQIVDLHDTAPGVYTLSVAGAMPIRFTVMK